MTASTLRPQDLPDIRITLAEARRDRIEQRLWRRQAAIPKESCWTDAGFSQESVEESKWEALSRADLFYVAPAMAELAHVAAKTVPDFDITPEDLPSPYGLIIFGGAPPAFVDTGVYDGCQCGEPHHNVFAGVLWAQAVQADGTPGFHLFPVLDRHATAQAKSKEPDPGLARFTILHTTFVPHECDRVGGTSRPFIAGMVRAVRTASMLMHQPLAEVAQESPDRATQKRVRRAGYEPRPIRVIELRRPKSAGSGDGSTEYHHQWIVRGHWRNHWHPKREVHRPIWIAPHVKGPEGAPLIGGEKVYALKR